MSEHSRPMREDARVANIPVDRLRAHPRNVRADLGDLRDLSESIRYEGVLVNLMVEQRGDGRGAWFQILHGHRRWAAAQIAGVVKVPCTIVPPHADRDAIFLMLAEDKKQPIDRADKHRAVQVLRNEFGCTWQVIAERLGYSVPTVRAWADTADEPATLRPVPASVRPRRTVAPKVGPRAVHDLLTRLDAGDIDPTAVVEEMRAWLGDWQPLRSAS